MRRRAHGSHVRDEYAARVRDMLRVTEQIGDDRRADQCRADLAALAAGEPVVVGHAWQAGGRGDGTVCLEPDGTVTALEPVYANPEATPRTAIGYLRPDGTAVGGRGLL